MKKENLQRNDGPGDALARGYGRGQDITLAFIALAYFIYGSNRLIRPITAGRLALRLGGSLHLAGGVSLSLGSFVENGAVPNDYTHLERVAEWSTTGGVE